MAGLRCAEVSPLAWRALQGRVAAAIGVLEDAMQDAIRRLAAPIAGDPAIAAGPSGACGVAAVVALMCDPALADAREALGLDATARVMTIVTERATIAVPAVPVVPAVPAVLTPPPP
jgi:diaminopropionate ammonia-lyase